MAEKKPNAVVVIFCTVFFRTIRQVFANTYAAASLLLEKCVSQKDEAVITIALRGRSSSEFTVFVSRLSLQICRSLLPIFGPSQQKICETFKRQQGRQSSSLDKSILQPGRIVSRILIGSLEKLNTVCAERANIKSLDDR